MKKRYITIKSSDNGQRLDKVIPTYLPDLSRGQARKLIDSGAVFVDGKRTRKNSRKILEGQTVIVTIASPIQGSDGETRPSLDIEIIKEDKWYVVVSKPSGVPADETQSGWKGTLTDLLARAYNYKYLQTVHRLDLGTSGVMILSKTPAATKDLNRQFRERLVRKRYTALVDGVICDDRKTIINHLGRNPDDPRKFTSVASGGKRAVTHFTVETRFNDATLVTVKIETGRTHQIRVHLSEYGHSILGDSIYGSRRSTRLMLHASELELTCPRLGKPLHLRAPLPDEFSNWS